MENHNHQEHHHENETKTPEVQAQTTQSNPLTIPIAIVIAGALIAGAMFFRLRSNSNSIAGTGTQAQVAGQQQPTAQSVDILKVKTNERPFIGNPNASVIVAYWFDYQCPFCRKFETESMPQLVKDYVQIGKVKVVFKDFQFLGSDSQTAGLAEHAIWEISSDKFFEWHKAMYEKQDNENSGWGNKADILALTKSLGIDSTKVGELMISKAAEYQKMMDEDKAEGGALGVSGTPSFVIGKQLLVGAQPYSAIKQLIDLAGK